MDNNIDKELVLKLITDHIQKGMAWYESPEIVGYETSIEAEFGGEGQGELIYTVYKVKKGDQVVFVKCDGHYESYNGADFSYCEPYFAEPYEETIISWRTSK